MFYQYPLCKWLSKNKDGVFVLKLQGHVKYVGTTFDDAHPKKMKKAIKFLLTNSTSPLQKAYEMRKLVAVKWMYEDDQTKAKEIKEQLEKKYKLTDKNKWIPA